jgi:hypothetical protein
VPYQAPRPAPVPPRVMDDPSGINELWWGRANWSWNDPGITPFWDNTAGLRFTGEIKEQLDIYMRRNLTMNAQFFLSADRISPDIVGMVQSAPAANVFGLVGGMTQAGLWDFGDQWCKCWLDLHQTVFVQFPPAGVWIPLSSNLSTIPLNAPLHRGKPGTRSCRVNGNRKWLVEGSTATQRGASALPCL